MTKKNKSKKGEAVSTVEEATSHRPDIYIGLVGAVGTNLSGIRNELQAQLAIVGYTVQHIKVSELIREALDVAPETNELNRIQSLMAAGDAIRHCSEEGDGVAALIISEIRRRRGEKELLGCTAFIIDSLKNPAEIELLDQIYVRNFYTLSVYLSKEERERNLAIKIAGDSREPPSAKHEAKAKELLVADEKSQGSHAQNVRDTFPKGDYFVNSRKDLQKQVKRFVELIFGEPFATPTEDEYNMFLAKSASYRTADLSRQVGAIIIDKCGSVAGTGCNEVPYPGGGFFVEGQKGGIGDNRDFVKQIDPNYAEIQRSLIELVRILRRAGYIGDNKTDFKADIDLVDALLQGHHKELMSNARIRNLIEFGRIVHAEMHALCDAASSGRSVAGGKLYCTTFPCHGCARHLIAAGIREVVYIEPYPKSLSLKLYDNEIELAHEEEENCNPNDPFDKVKFRPFHGTSPVLFQRVFQFRKRKDNRGIVASWVPGEAFPSGASLTVERPKKEASAANKVAEVLERAKVQLGISEGEISDDVADITAAD